MDGDSEDEVKINSLYEPDAIFSILTGLHVHCGFISKWAYFKITTLFLKLFEHIHILLNAGRTISLEIKDTGFNMFYLYSI